jgi:hypothetical protein
VSALSAHVTVDGNLAAPERALGTAGQAPALPGRLIVQLPAIAADVAVTLSAALANGGQTQASGQVRSEPHRQVFLPITLLGGAIADLGVGNDLAAPADLLAPVVRDLAGVDFALAVLARDDFQRADQNGWGAASDGHAWGGDANGTLFAISKMTGAVANIGANTFNATLGPQANDEDVLVVATLTAPTGGIDFGPVARYADANNFYRAHLTGSTFMLERRVGGTSTPLASVSFATSLGATYAIRLRAVGTQVQAKAWLASQSEPSAFALQVDDSSLARGHVGVDLQLSGTVTVAVSNFLALGN